ncbi:MAG: zinc ABC transporter substrate-binding protein [Desulfocapsa sp.]|nr:zinc ABC transporter substrate-binding protein [Desulfocapsa sp.]
MTNNGINKNGRLAWEEKYLKNNRVLLVLLFFFSLLLPAQLVAESGSELEVFVSIPPQKWLCEQLGEGLIRVHLLVEKGQEPHGFEPAPRKIQALSRSRLLFTVGLEFEQELTRRLKTTSPYLRIVDTSEAIEKKPMADTTHVHGEELDPHVWLSPPNLKSMAAVMAAALIEEDPGHEHVYRKKLRLLNSLLDDLDQDIAATLAPYRGASFFVFHPAFGYFSRRYGLQQMAVETGGKSPTPKQLFALIRRAKADNVRVIFVQPQFDPRSAQSVATAIGGNVVPLDPLAEDPIRNLGNMATEIGQALEKRKNL